MNNLKFDVTLKGMVTRWDGNCLTGSQIEVAARECILHHEKNARWNFSTPKLVSLFVKNTQQLPEKKRLSLLTPGAEVKLRVRATISECEVTVISAIVPSSSSTLDFLCAVSGFVQVIPVAPKG
ncbi:MAG: hypothetical protein IJ677_07480 [Alphaproteobacteria bacterium]|nr:hypothetical protein [Alphaproteobacteria bacterium]